MSLALSRPCRCSGWQGTASRMTAAETGERLGHCRDLEYVPTPRRQVEVEARSNQIAAIAIVIDTA
jgi:hypothetical protein